MMENGKGSENILNEEVETHNKLIKSQKINIEGMNEGHFFENVLTCIIENGWLSEETIQKLQLQTINCLTEQIEKFTAGKSSSIPEEKAKKLLDSIYFTLGFRLMQLTDIDQSITLLQHKSIKELFEEGQHFIESRFEKLKLEFELLESELLPTQNIAYRDTYEIGLTPFFKLYDPKFESQEVPCNIDYPLSNDKMERVGIDYMIHYIEKSLWEHSLCLKFDFKEIEKVLKGYHEGYEHLLINIYEHVLMNAIGRLLAGKDLSKLLLEAEDLETIEKVLEILPDAILEKKLKACGNKCLESLGLTEIGMRSYTVQTINKFVPRIIQALEDGTLDKIFISSNSASYGQVEYIGGERLTDSVFKAITEKIRESETTEEKIKKINANIQSAEDLKDVLEADCLFNEEYIRLYESLQDVELALLIHLNRADEYGILEISDEVEEEWMKWLKAYLGQLPAERNQEIYDMANKIKRKA